MKQAWDFLKGKKTYILAGISALLYAAQHAGITFPGMPPIDGHAIEIAIFSATIRHGIASA